MLPFAENLKEPCEGCGALQALADGEIHETERINSTDNRWYHIVSVPITDDAGRVTHVLESSTDISGRKRTEEVRDQAMRELERPAHGPVFVPKVIRKDIFL